MKRLNLSISAVLLALTITLVHGQTALVLSSTAPATTSTDIVNFVTGGVGGNDYSNKNSPPGQTFTTLSAPGGYDLTAVTVEGANSAGFSAGMPWTLAIYSVSGSTLTTLASQEFDFASTPAGYASDYLTFDLTASIALLPSTEYAFTISQYEGGYSQNPSSYYGFENSSANSYSGGTAFQGSTPTGYSSASISSTDGYDMSFAVDLTVPEPSTWAMLAGGVAVLLGLMRFRRQLL